MPANYEIRNLIEALVRDNLPRGCSHGSQIWAATTIAYIRDEYRPSAKRPGTLSYMRDDKRRVDGLANCIQRLLDVPTEYGWLTRKQANRVSEVVASSKELRDALHASVGTRTSMAMHIIDDPDDIAHIYEHGPGFTSCMRGGGVPAECLTVYGRPGTTSLAICYDAKKDWETVYHNPNLVLARTILLHDHTDGAAINDNSGYYVRIFANSGDTAIGFARLLNSRGFKRLRDETASVILNHRSDYMPYLDFSEYVELVKNPGVGKYWSVGGARLKGDDRRIDTYGCQTTSGYLGEEDNSDLVECVDCGNEIDPRYVVAVDGDDVCPRCLETNYIRCPSSGDYVHRSDAGVHLWLYGYSTDRAGLLAAWLDGGGSGLVSDHVVPLHIPAATVMRPALYVVLVDRVAAISVPIGQDVSLRSDVLDVFDTYNDVQCNGGLDHHDFRLHRTQGPRVIAYTQFSQEDTRDLVLGHIAETEYTAAAAA